MNKQFNHSFSLKEEDRADSLKTGILLIIIACIMTAFSTILTVRGILDIHSANVCFGLITWYIFSVCAIIAGCSFIKHSMTYSSAGQKQTA